MVDVESSIVLRYVCMSSELLSASSIIIRVAELCVELFSLIIPEPGSLVVVEVLNLYLNVAPPKLPSCPLVPDVPLVPLVPLLPLVPLVPLDPLTPLVPLEPLLPLVPLEPLVPLVPLLPLVPLEPGFPPLPSCPLVPLVPLEPLVPDVPLLPLVPLEPDVPLVPLVPDVPLVPLVPLEKFVPCTYVSIASKSCCISSIRNAIGPTKSEKPSSSNQRPFATDSDAALCTLSVT